MNDFHNFLHTRRSIRNFLPQPVSNDALKRILETTTYAPSAHNRQPWRFALLTSAEAKEGLADAMGADFRRDLSKDNLPDDEINTRIERSRSRILGAPVVIVLCMDSSEMDAYPDDRRGQAERTMAIQSTALAGLQLMLAAHAEGLGSVWTCGPLFAPEVVHAALDLPDEWQPQAMIFIGYPAEEPGPRLRTPVQEISLWM